VSMPSPRGSGVLGSHPSIRFMESGGMLLSGIIIASGRASPLASGGSVHPLAPRTVAFGHPPLSSPQPNRKIVATEKNTFFMASSLLTHRLEGDRRVRQRDRAVLDFQDDVVDMRWIEVAVLWRRCSRGDREPPLAVCDGSTKKLRVRRSRVAV